MKTEQGVRFKAIGKAAIQGTKQIGKTLTAMSDSPDKRGRGKLAEVNAAQHTQQKKRKRKSKRKSTAKATDQSLGLDTSKLLISLELDTGFKNSSSTPQVLVEWLLLTREEFTLLKALSTQPRMLRLQQLLLTVRVKG